MSPHGLLTILEKEKEKYIRQHNNEKEVQEMIKKQTSFSHILYKTNPAFLIAYYFTFIFSSAAITEFIISFIDPYRLSVITGVSTLFASFFSSILIGVFILKNGSKFLFNKRKNKHKIIESILEKNFYNEKVSDEVFSYLKIILTDDEYFELMKDKKYITNKEAFDIVKLKIHKNEILMDKKNLVLDLTKLKEYNIKVNG